VKHEFPFAHLMEFLEGLDWQLWLVLLQEVLGVVFVGFKIVMWASSLCDLILSKAFNADPICVCRLRELLWMGKLSVFYLFQ
jgi:hypothetical protein